MIFIRFFLYAVLGTILAINGMGLYGEKWYWGVAIFFVTLALEFSAKEEK